MYPIIGQAAGQMERSIVVDIPLNIDMSANYAEIGKGRLVMPEVIRPPGVRSGGTMVWPDRVSVRPVRLEGR